MSPIRMFAVAALVASIGTPAVALAQNAPAPAPAASGLPAGKHGHHHSHFMRALHTLNLTDAQKQQIDAAFAQTRQENQTADPQTRHANMQKLRTQIEGILTPQQRTQLQAELQKERTERERGPEPAASGSPAPHN